MKPYLHAVSSAKIFGGTPEEYLELHQFMDSSKGAFACNRHRALTHNSWFIAPDGPLEKAFGVYITNSKGRKVMVRDIGEQHVAEDFGGYIPSVQDYLENMQFQEWMNGKGVRPSSTKGLRRETRSTLKD